LNDVFHAVLFPGYEDIHLSVSRDCI
jgi:hypothetical protein